MSARNVSAGQSPLHTKLSHFAYGCTHPYHRAENMGCGKDIDKVEKGVMKKFRVLSIPVLIVMMCLFLFAQEPQGGGRQGTPGGDAGARGAGGHRGGGEVEAAEQLGGIQLHTR